MVRDDRSNVGREMIGRDNRGLIENQRQERERKVINESRTDWELNLGAIGVEKRDFKREYWVFSGSKP